MAIKAILNFKHLYVTFGISTQTHFPSIAGMLFVKFHFYLRVVKLPFIFILIYSEKLKRSETSNALDPTREKEPSAMVKKTHFSYLVSEEWKIVKR